MLTNILVSGGVTLNKTGKVSAFMRLDFRILETGNKQVHFRSEVLEGNKEGGVTEGDGGSAAYLGRMVRESLSGGDLEGEKERLLEELQEGCSRKVRASAVRVTCLRNGNQARVGGVW